MSSSQFAFLEEEFANVFTVSEKAEQNALGNPGASVVYAYHALDIAISWMFEHDVDLPQPYDTTLAVRLNEPAFVALVGEQVTDLAKKVERAGLRALEESKTPSSLDAVEIVSGLFQFCRWFVGTYGRTSKPDMSLQFHPELLPTDEETRHTSRQDRRELIEQLRLSTKSDELQSGTTETPAELEQERSRLLAEVAEAKKAAKALPAGADKWSELHTRRYKIDRLLAEAGFRSLVDGRDVEFEVSGMPSASGVGYVDYVLWGDNGLPLGLIEAKKTTISPQTGKHQAELYADCLEAQFGQRPIVFYSNGYDHWIWDDVYYAPRKVQGFYTKDQLEILIQRRSGRKTLSVADVRDEISDRYYQKRAIQAVSERFEKDRHRSALIVMATGAGKTRTVISLVDVLMRANWVKRVLFLADRNALVNQAVDRFKKHLPESAPVNLVKEGDEDGRVYVSTYQTMVHKLDEYNEDGTRRFGPGYFDLIIIDEAHRSVYRKYRGIFEYFDSLLVGLTATPKDEVDKNTYGLFDLPTGEPTDAYPLEQAVADKYLVPPKAVSVPLQIMRRGIRYEDLSEEEKDDWDELDWGEDEDGTPLSPPEEIDAAEINRRLFNEDTVDKVLAHLMKEGIKVAGGDRIGKTIIFAQNQAHAEFIYKRFIASYPALDNGKFADVITHSTRYAHDLIEKFTIKEKSPHIAISVDMLDTGIDVPEVVNLVFFKPVRSKTKFWQMIGRGTRTCEDLFGPGDDKTEFNVFDFCGNLEFFSMDAEPAQSSSAESLSERIFKARLELVQRLGAVEGLGDERAEVAKQLRKVIESMEPDNFLVRPHLELVERFRDEQSWEHVSVGELSALADRLAALPNSLNPEHEDAKRFDVLLLGAQLALLKGRPFERERNRIIKIADALESQPSIPAIAKHLTLIAEIQAPEWWEGVTYPMLEEVRKKLRDLTQLIERGKKAVIYSDFEDAMGESSIVELVRIGAEGAGTGLEQYEKKVKYHLKGHLDEPAVKKVRAGEPLTESDLLELQDILAVVGIDDVESFGAALQQDGGVPDFIRSLVGVDRAAAKRAFGEFLDDQRYSRNQIEFVNHIIDYLTMYGVIEPGRVYESPFVELAPQGPEQLFGEDVERLFELIGEFRSAAIS